MKKFNVLFALLLFSQNAICGITLETLASALSIPNNAPYSANGMEVMDDVKGIKWEDKDVVYIKGGTGSADPTAFNRSGIITLEHLGKVEFVISGNNGRFLEFSIYLNEYDGHKLLKKDKFTSIISAQFRKTATIKNIRGGCPSDGAISGSAVYEVTLPNKKPIFIEILIDVGGNAPNSGMSVIEAALENKDHIVDGWKCID